jgi:hypothetical protein
VRRQLDADRVAVPEHDVDGEAVHEELGFVADQVLVDVDLLTGLAVHEYVLIPFGIDVRHLALFDVRRLELFARLPGALEDGTGGQVLDLAAREGLALAGLDELEVDDGVGSTVHHDLQVFLDVRRIHQVLPRGETDTVGQTPTMRSTGGGPTTEPARS